MPISLSTNNKDIEDLQKLYETLYTIYNKDTKTAEEKWTTIAVEMNDEHELIYRVYRILRRLNTDTEIDYDIKEKDLGKLWQSIRDEQTLLVKSSLIISGLHYIIYDIMSTKGNYYFKLDGRKEMDIIDKKLMYYINISSKVEYNIYFHAFILLYGLESCFNKHFYIGIDFEYTNKKIQLGQLNFEHNVTLSSFIMIINPDELEPHMSSTFVNMIMTNRNINKILHGSDALDIPYIYDKLFEGDKDKIIKFTNSFIDTKIICDYYKSNSPLPTDEKCSIYDAVKYFDVITEQKYKELEDIVERMQPHQDIRWNIHHMPKSYVLYALYDVIFLKYFYYRMINVATKSDNTDLEKKATIHLYKHILYEYTQFIYLENKGITNIILKCKEEVDPINNYMVFVNPNKKVYKLIDIFNNISGGVKIANPAAELDRLLNVKFFKKTSMMLKKISYTATAKLTTIYENKSTRWNSSKSLNNQFIYDNFKEMKYNNLLAIFQEVEKVFTARIKVILNL